ncbi:hypothetical protein vseg_017253 [Gypsophila vaccaria]
MLKVDEVVVNGGNSHHTIENDANLSKEQHKLSLMRASLESFDPSFKEADDLMLRRFLRARNLNVEKAVPFFLKYQKWRKSFVPKGYISEAEVQDDLAHNKVLFGGLDKKGRPLTVLLARRHVQNSKVGGLEEFKRYCVYVLDKIVSRIPAGLEKFVVVVDLKGFGYSNTDIRGYIGAFSILQDCYPERLDKLLLVDAPKVFMIMWKMIYPFIDDNTKTKIEFVNNKQLKSTLLVLMDESQIPNIYGGTVSLTPIQDA